MQIAGGQQQEQTPRKIHPEAVMMELQQAASRYEEGCTFQVGDVVTAVDGRSAKGLGMKKVAQAIRGEEGRLRFAVLPFLSIWIDYVHSC